MNSSLHHDPDRYRQLRDLVDRVAERPAAEWASFLERQCPTDPTLRGKALRLLEHTQAASAEGFLEPTAPTVESSSGSVTHEEPVPGSAEPIHVGKYRIVRRFAEGTGQAAAYLAFDPDLERHVVLKRYHGRSGEAEEGRALAKVVSPYVARCHGIERIDGAAFLVVEYVPGGNLAEVRRDGPLGIEVAVGIVAQLAEGVAAVHARGLIHRDIKPANVILHDDGAPRLVDFGLAAYLGSERLRELGGSPPYMAPEQARGEGDRVDHRTDVFGLGAVLYQLLTDRAPYAGSTDFEVLEHAKKADVTPPRQFEPTIPAPLEAVCLKALAAAPENRYTTALEFAAALRQAIEPTAVATPPPDRLPARVRRGLPAPVVACALVALAAWLWPRGSETATPVAIEADLKNRSDDPSTLLHMQNYARLLDDLGRRKEAADWAMRSMNDHLRVLKFKHPDTQGAIGTAIAFCMHASRNEEALGITDRMLEHARRELGADDPRTLGLLSERVSLLYTLGDLAGAGSTAEELVGARTRKPGREDLQTLSALANLAVIRRDQGESAKARTLLARLGEDARRAVDSVKTGRLGPDEVLNLRRHIAFAEVVGRNLGRPERSGATPGTPGGPPRIDAPYRTESPVADGRISPGEYGESDGFAFDFAGDRNPGRSYLFDETTRATKHPSDLSVRMHAAHTGTALFLAVSVRDQSVQADPAAATIPYKNDGVELFLDGDRIPNDLTYINPFGNHEGFQIIADALGNRYSSAPAVRDTRWQVGTARTAGGYVIEFEIPLALIDTQDGPGFRPAATGSELRINVAINDIDEANNKQTFYGMLWAEDRLWSPLLGGEDFWPVTLRLVPAPTPDR
jgi:hypothetical protein